MLLCTVLTLVFIEQLCHGAAVSELPGALQPASSSSIRNLEMVCVYKSPYQSRLESGMLKGDLMKWENGDSISSQVVAEGS